METPMWHMYQVKLLMNSTHKHQQLHENEYFFNELSFDWLLGKGRGEGREFVREFIHINIHKQAVNPLSKTLFNE